MPYQAGIPRGPQSEAHKAAIQEGRQQGILIRRYLDWIEHSNTKTPGRRKRSVESVDKRLTQIDETFPTADNLTRLTLVQERINLLIEREQIQANVEAGAIEDRFVSTAADYGEKKGITYTAWREMGVKPEVLERAGIKRSVNPLLSLSANGDSDDYPVKIAAEG